MNISFMINLYVTNFYIFFPDLFVSDRNKFISGPATKTFLTNIFVSQNRFLTVSMQLFMRQ